MPYKKQNILFVKGIHSSDIKTVEDDFQSMLNQKMGYNISTPIQVQTIYRANPSKFTSLDTWPTVSNCKCFNCDLFFNTQPWPMITNIAIKNNKKEYRTSKNFCNPCCVQAYINRMYSDNKQLHDDLTHMFVDFLPQMGCNRVYKVVEAESKERREEYAGSDNGLSTDEFRAKLKIQQSGLFN